MLQSKTRMLILRACILKLIFKEGNFVEFYFLTVYILINFVSLPFLLLYSSLKYVLKNDGIVGTSSFF